MAAPRALRIRAPGAVQTQRAAARRLLRRRDGPAAAFAAAGPKGHAARRRAPVTADPPLPRRFRGPLGDASADRAATAALHEPRSAQVSCTSGSGAARGDPSRRAGCSAAGRACEPADSTPLSRSAAASWCAGDTSNDTPPANAPQTSRCASNRAALAADAARRSGIAPRAKCEALSRILHPHTNVTCVRSVSRFLPVRIPDLKIIYV